MFQQPKLITYVKAHFTSAYLLLYYIRVNIPVMHVCGTSRVPSRPAGKNSSSRQENKRKIVPN